MSGLAKHSRVGKVIKMPSWAIRWHPLNLDKRLREKPGVSKTCTVSLPKNITHTGQCAHFASKRVKGEAFHAELCSKSFVGSASGANPGFKWSETDRMIDEDRQNFEYINRSIYIFKILSIFINHSVCLRSFEAWISSRCTTNKRFAAQFSVKCLSLDSFRSKVCTLSRVCDIFWQWYSTCFAYTRLLTQSFVKIQGVSSDCSTGHLYHLANSWVFGKSWHFSRGLLLYLSSCWNSWISCVCARY